MKATLVWQKPSSHPTRPLPCGKWYLSSVFLDFSVIILSVCIRMPQIKYFVTKTIFCSFMVLLSTFQKPCHLPVCLHDPVSVSFPYSLPLGATSSISPFAGLGSCVVSFLSSPKSCLLSPPAFPWPCIGIFLQEEVLLTPPCPLWVPCSLSFNWLPIPRTKILLWPFHLLSWDSIPFADSGIFLKVSLSIWTLHVLSIACWLKMAQSSSKLSQISTSAIAQANDPKFSYL